MTFTLSSAFPMDSGKASNHPLKQSALNLFKSFTETFPSVPPSQEHFTKHSKAAAPCLPCHLLLPSGITDQCVPLQILELASNFNCSNRHSPVCSYLWLFTPQQDSHKGIESLGYERTPEKGCQRRKNTSLFEMESFSMLPTLGLTFWAQPPE